MSNAERREARDRYKNLLDKEDREDEMDENRRIQIQDLETGITNIMKYVSRKCMENDRNIREAIRLMNSVMRHIDNARKSNMRNMKDLMKIGNRAMYNRMFNYF